MKLLGGILLWLTFSLAGLYATCGYPQAAMRGEVRPKEEEIECATSS